MFLSFRSFVTKITSIFWQTKLPTMKITVSHSKLTLYLQLTIHGEHVIVNTVAIRGGIDYIKQINGSN